MISMTPTTYMNCWSVMLSTPVTSGVRYTGQSTSRLKNLSSPKTTGATVNTVRSRANACHDGSRLNTDACWLVATSRSTLVMIVLCSWDGFQKPVILTLEPADFFCQELLF